MGTTNLLIDELITQNQSFVRDGFSAERKMMPRKKTLILGCVDPRVDPDAIFGLEFGDTAVIRNVGGRVTPSTFETLAMLDQVVKAGGGRGEGWNLIVLHHTDCGITRLTGEAEMLGKFFGVPATQLEGLAITDPRASVAIDIAALKANTEISNRTVTGMVYDCATGKVEIVVPSAMLRA